MYYASGDDKNDADHFRLGRRHRVYFFRLRPPGLGMSYATEYGKPVRHCEAPRPFVDFIEPINANSANDDVQYTLKAGPDGLVALLVKPDGKKAVASGPLCVWDWRHGDCVGVRTVQSNVVLTTGCTHHSRSRTHPRLRLSHFQAAHRS